MPAANMPWTKPQFFTDAGEPAALYKLFSYDAGTTTKRTTYSDSALSSANDNPIILDAFGRASVYLLPQRYKFVLAPPNDSDPPIAPMWTADQVPSAGEANTYDVPGTAGETLTANDLCYLSDGGVGTAGRWYKADADEVLTSKQEYALGFVIAGVASGAEGTFRRDGIVTGLSGLTPGAVYYVSTTPGVITTTTPVSPIRHMIIGKAESTTTLVINPLFGAAASGQLGTITNTAQVIPVVVTMVPALVAPDTTVAFTAIGGSSSPLATIGGSYIRDVTQYDMPANSNAPMTQAFIEANMFLVDGRGIQLWWGTPFAPGGTGGTITLLIRVDGTTFTVQSFPGSTGGWTCGAKIFRVSSSAVDVTTWCKTSAGTAYSNTKTTRVTGLTFTGQTTLNSGLTTDPNVSTEQTFFLAKAL